MRRADATRTKVDLAGIGFRIGDELDEVVGWKCRMDVHHVGQSHYAGDRDAVADKIKRKLLVEPRVDSVVRADEGDCVAIGLRVERGLHADIAGRAGPVLNDKLLSQMIRQVLADDARRCRWGRPPQKRRSSAPAATDMFALTPPAGRQETRQLPRPDAEVVCGGEVS